jgi:hypothetical protein
MKRRGLLVRAALVVTLGAVGLITAPIEAEAFAACTACVSYCGAPGQTCTFLCPGSKGSQCYAPPYSDYCGPNASLLMCGMF